MRYTLPTRRRRRWGEGSLTRTARLKYTDANLRLQATTVMDCRRLELSLAVGYLPSVYLRRTVSVVCTNEPMDSFERASQHQRPVEDWADATQHLK